MIETDRATLLLANPHFVADVTETKGWGDTFSPACLLAPPINEVIALCGSVYAYCLEELYLY